MFRPVAIPVAPFVAQEPAIIEPAKTAPTAAENAIVSSEEDAYTVVSGDTLWDIAERFTGNPFNYHALARINAIPNPALIEVGQRIRIK